MIPRDEKIQWYPRRDAPVTDKEKHEWCSRRTGFHAVFLTPSEYNAAERRGICMSYYVIQKLIPAPAKKPVLGSVFVWGDVR
jgi:hypothetical protein